MIVKEIETNSLITKSNLPASDYVINPYIGCPHACKYCYASFMKRFTNHKEDWGEFIDIKRCLKPFNLKPLIGKRIFIASVTDCYNPYEREYQLMPDILRPLSTIDAEVNISTKSDLILRDIELLKKMPNLVVSMSINTLDEDFKNDMDKASSIESRLATLKALHEAGIKTVLFMSPMFPYITDFKAIINASSTFIDEYWFENLNLRGDYKKNILEYIKNKYPEYYSYYIQIYCDNDFSYFANLEKEIISFCEGKNIKYQNFFYHNKLVQEKLSKEKTGA